MPEPADILEKLPKKTPVWAVGVTTVLIALVTCLITVYVVGKEDISKTITWSQASHDRFAAADDINDSKAIDGVLAIISTNMTTLAEINKALGVAQLQASNLTTRVEDLEKAVERLKSSLSTCETNLKTCLDDKHVKALK